MAWSAWRKFENVRNYGPSFRERCHTVYKGTFTNDPDFGPSSPHLVVPLVDYILQQAAQRDAATLLRS